MRLPLGRFDTSPPSDHQPSFLPILKANRSSLHFFSSSCHLKLCASFRMALAGSRPMSRGTHNRPSRYVATAANGEETSGWSCLWQGFWGKDPGLVPETLRLEVTAPPRGHWQRCVSLHPPPPAEHPWLRHLWPKPHLNCKDEIRKFCTDPCEIISIHNFRPHPLAKVRLRTMRAAASSAGDGAMKGLPSA